MSNVLTKISQSVDFKKKDRIPYINAVVLMGLFTFLFLGAEYLYVDVLSRMVSEDKTVLAQNYALGVSAAGFLLYPLLNRFYKNHLKAVCFVMISLASVLCIALIGMGTAYTATFIAGLVLFLLLGLFGSAVFLCFHAYDENRQVFGKDCGYFLCAGYPLPVCKQQSCSFGDC